MLVEEVRQEINSFLRLSGMPPHVFGKAAMNDTRFVARLDRPKCDLKASTIDKVRAYIRAETVKINRRAKRKAA